MLSQDASWAEAKAKAYRENAWFIPEFIDKATANIATRFLPSSLLQEWAARYHIPDNQPSPRKIGVVMAGNIPLVGFHDLLCVFISGHRLVARVSSKDDVLIKHLAGKLAEWDPSVTEYIMFAERLPGCDAYIATGSNNSGRYFEYYFGKYPHIIRKNRTSAAILDGTETDAELKALCADIQLYFGLGCRNVTQLYVPENYDFIPLLESLKEYAHFLQFHKYKHNFDYHLALLIMGNKYYMTNDSVVLTENSSPFSPVSQVHYTFYKDAKEAASLLENSTDIQCITGHGYIPFGQAQSPGLMDYADGVDTMQFLIGMADGKLQMAD
jgi:hypothetical protein